MGLFDLIEERRLERERRMRKEKAANVVKIIASVGVGAILGVLFAPKSGKKTRQDIADMAKKGIGLVNENANTAIKVIKDKSTELKEAVVEKYDQISNKNIPETISENIEKLEEKVENTMEKVEEIKEKLEEKVKEVKKKESKE